MSHSFSDSDWDLLSIIVEVLVKSWPLLVASALWAVLHVCVQRMAIVQRPIPDGDDTSVEASASDTTVATRLEPETLAGHATGPTMEVTFRSFSVGLEDTATPQRLFDTTPALPAVVPGRASESNLRNRYSFPLGASDVLQQRAQSTQSLFDDSGHGTPRDSFSTICSVPSSTSLQKAIDEVERSSEELQHYLSGYYSEPASSGSNISAYASNIRGIRMGEQPPSHSA